MNTHWTWRFVIDWTSRMSNKYGGNVIDNGGFIWDWGQALMREMYGVEWMEHPAFKFEDAKTSNEPLDQEVIEKAIRWEQGEYPSWWVFNNHKD